MRRIILQPCENSNNLGICFASLVRIQMILENVLQARGTFVRFCLKRFIVGTVPSVLVSFIFTTFPFTTFFFTIYNAKPLEVKDWTWACRDYTTWRFELRGGTSSSPSWSSPGSRPWTKWVKAKEVMNIETNNVSYWATVVECPQTIKVTH